MLILKSKLRVSAITVGNLDDNHLSAGVLDGALDHVGVLYCFVKVYFTSRANGVLEGAVDVLSLVSQIDAVLQNDSLQITDLAFVGRARVNWHFS